ncbi:hypothetical protein [[Mycobacterium] burgundiense]|uniref:Uncharacterized protein n=1 Tax=[Mycobacterium] burgundiense TaxID=3064286 RepID=A0ABM9LH59_9MYCO|nr:hypothetical protein [Mycolicibacterium sp. MU0053]CAJ1498915.1 hypothetical protein MU0053_001277 [Mycolicibacterium sp. MU0053]
MGKLSAFATQWWPFAILLLLSSVAVLDMSGKLGAVYRWMVRYMPPEVWSALAAWVAVAVGIVTVVVAGRYAKQQVDKAQEQVREAREARLDQERHAREAIETQVRIAEEQAQPNVVLYTELNPSAKQFVEIVVKNFGTTPAYHVKAAFDPPLKATPNLLSKGKLADVPIPEFPILAPGQEWRTGWDHSVSRKQHQKEWAPVAGKKEPELTDEQKLMIQAYMSYTGEAYSYEQAIADMTLPPRHTAVVTYEDSHGKHFETKAVLDSELFKGTTWVDIKTVHDLAKTLEQQLKEQNRGLGAIHRRLAEFGTEHDGIWIYTSSDDEERQYRRSISNAEAQESRESHDHLEWAMSGRKGDDPWRRPNPNDASQIPIETVNIGDWFIPGDDESFQVGQAWRVAFIKKHEFEDFGAVFELFRSDGDSIREREGTQIWCIRRPS